MIEVFIQVLDVQDNCVCYCSFKVNDISECYRNLKVIRRKYKFSIVKIYQNTIQSIRIKPKPNFKQLNKKSYD